MQKKLRLFSSKGASLPMRRRLWKFAKNHKAAIFRAAFSKFFFSMDITKFRSGVFTRFAAAIALIWIAQAGFYNNEVRTNPHTSTTYNSMTFNRISQFATGASYFAQGGDPDAQNPDASDPNYAGLLTHGVNFSFENEFRLPLIFNGRG